MSPRTATGLLVHIEPRGGGGLQEQICESIRRAILSGSVRPGTRLPSSRALAADLGVSRTTTLLAFDQLQAEGYLWGRHGSGTFVAEDLPDDAPPPAALLPPPSPDRPPLSRRGTALAAATPSARRIQGPPRAFRIGVPALDAFPVRQWSRLAGRRMTSATSVQLDYGWPAGLPALREAIADHVQRSRGARCHPDQVYVVGGAQRGFDIICRLLLDPGSRAWMEEPGYPGAWTALTAAGASIVPVDVDEEGLRVHPDGPAGRGVRLAYVTPSHQFPLGMTMSLGRRLALLQWARGAGAWIVEDDYDSEFRYGTPPIPCLQGLDTDGRVIYVGSFSKSAFPALRLGFLIAPPELHAHLLTARRRAADPQPPFLDQAVMADFMGGGHFARHLRRMRAVYRERLEALADAARRFCAGTLRLRPVRTGLHAVADLDGVEDVRVFEEAMARGVEVMPLSAYFRRRSPSGNALVLGFGAVRPEA
ncbi:MAG TPA: PLP-dependent aminotransferase family protein, partial [Vicinamibacteria bacterium]|nr:PLP-dependent aminotransferase family protein [Vicinamibacteria bacterium]